jgi:hypothetical protein
MRFLRVLAIQPHAEPSLARPGLAAPSHLHLIGRHLRGDPIPQEDVIPAVLAVHPTPLHLPPLRQRAQLQADNRGPLAWRHPPLRFPLGLVGYGILPIRPGAYADRSRPAGTAHAVGLHAAIPRPWGATLTAGDRARARLGCHGANTFRGETGAPVYGVWTSSPPDAGVCFWCSAPQVQGHQSGTSAHVTYIDIDTPASNGHRSDTGQFNFISRSSSLVGITQSSLFAWACFHPLPPERQRESP